METKSWNLEFGDRLQSFGPYRVLDKSHKSAIFTGVVGCRLLFCYCTRISVDTLLYFSLLLLHISSDRCRVNWIL